MKMRFILFCYFIIGLCTTAYAQQDTVLNDPYYNPPPAPFTVLDSVIAADKAHAQFVKDSIAMRYIKAPDAAIFQQVIQQTLREKLYRGTNFLDIPSKTNSTVRDGHIRQTRDQWVIVIVISLLIYTALLNILLNKDMKAIVQSFYSKRVLQQASREDGYINLWAFLGLFILFGSTFGLFLYQLAAYNNTYYSIAGFRLFITLSAIILGLFAIKFLVLKFLGFIFDINKIVSEYISILNLTYFNIAFVFLPLAVCFSLLDAKLIPYLLALGMILIVMIFTWLYLRSSVNIISNIRFHKFYLIVYLCALEICPVLILIKALDI